ncbi:FlxA-like family protein [Clostridium sp. SHJSY1]|uniref:FlxA-like family protein n=1 Tax=Clostridium sp. SHJSY1 TaxID=2942483 RepID=UPI002876B2F4|nr:FlxA-like family protein [Clostridium sp. SHJSY1]MDS0525898.1 FlxA-like family protein [Clostridium sp. SHJSY1]
MLINGGVGSGNVTNQNKSLSIKTSQDSLISSLMKQKENLEKQVKDLQKSSNGMTAESTQSQIKELQKQIEDINAQISKAQSEKISDKINPKQDEIQSPKNISDKIISLDKNNNNIKGNYKTKKNLEGSARVLEGEVKLDKMRGVDTTKKEDKLDNIKESIANINSKFGSEFKKLNKLTKVSKEQEDTSNDKEKEVLESYDTGELINITK